MEQELQVASADTLATLNKSEIDQQIATAHAYPRAIKSFLDEARQLVTLSESVAGECVYSLPRGGKTIEGPSARFAEVMIHAWGNCRAGARVIGEDANFVTAQGIFHDLEKNSAITYEVKRRITDKNGKRFNSDMIGVTSNAACSIGLRNAALKGIPKALWSALYDETRKVIMGDIKTLSNRRAEMLDYLVRFGVVPDVAFQFLGVQGEEDITLEMMVSLRGLCNSLKTGETTLEKIVAGLGGDAAVSGGAPVKNGNGNQSKTAGLKDKLANGAGSSPKKKAVAKKKTASKAKAKEKVDQETGEVTAADPAPETEQAGDDAGPSLEEISALILNANNSAALDTACDVIALLPKADRDAARVRAAKRRAELEG